MKNVPRSGLTIGEEILASHSQVEGTMEVPDIMAMVARLRSNSDVCPGGIAAGCTR